MPLILRTSPRHNDLPWQLLTMFNNQLRDEKANLTSLAHTHTNIPKLKAGFVGGQVWLSSALQLPLLGSVRLLLRVLAERQALQCLLSPSRPRVFAGDS